MKCLILYLSQQEKLNSRQIFGQGDKTNDNTDKNGTKIHIVSQLDLYT